ncbi:MAG: FkbM family methyltransferase [Verrucomicrobia bacterium]|nr:FkbM family methyltransferase [Verrucomicrobiota bacterium]
MNAALQSTRFKMASASVVLALLRLVGVRPLRTIVRKGITYAVDLREGIDMNLFLFGSYQSHVVRTVCGRLAQDPVIIDVGANIGAISLALSAQKPDSTIYAFEPTGHAYNKLLRNVELNGFESRITPIQSFVSAVSSSESALSAYSSWRLDRVDDARHPIHMGISKEATTTQTSIDDFMRDRNVTKLDLIKIDTDGHELDVLKGATRTLESMRPLLIFELTTYLLASQGIDFSEYEALLAPFDYRLVESQSGRSVTSSNVHDVVPSGGGIDVLAIPPGTDPR